MAGGARHRRHGDQQDLLDRLDAGRRATYDLSNFGEDQVDDLRPGHWLTFSQAQIADLNNEAAPDAAIPGAGQHLQRPALQRRHALAGQQPHHRQRQRHADRQRPPTTGSPPAPATTPSIADGGNDTVSGGAGADTIDHFGTGSSVNILRDTPGRPGRRSSVLDFGIGAVDILGVQFGRAASRSRAATGSTIAVGGVTIELNGTSRHGEFMIDARGSGDDAPHDGGFVTYLPALAEGSERRCRGDQRRRRPALPDRRRRGRASRSTCKSAVSAYNNALGDYKVAADGTIPDVAHPVRQHAATWRPARTVDLGTPGNGEHIGFFLIQNGSTSRQPAGQPSFVTPGTAGGQRRQRSRRS